MLAVLLPSGGSACALARHFPLEDLISTAHRVVHAKVTGEAAAFDAANRQIWTTWTLEVTGTLKNAAPAGPDLAAGSIVAHSRGGTVGRITQRSSGEPRLAVDGEYVLFLWKDDAGYWNILGQSQGAFMVIREEGKAARARNSYRGTRVVTVNGQPLLEKVGPIDRELDTLKDDIRAASGSESDSGAGDPDAGTAAVGGQPQDGDGAPPGGAATQAGASGHPVIVPVEAGRAA
jgi:hypothetical protein